MVFASCHVFISIQEHDNTKSRKQPFVDVTLIMKVCPEVCETPDKLKSNLHTSHNQTAGWQWPVWQKIQTGK
jgi:hypothetical protein